MTGYKIPQGVANPPPFPFPDGDFNILLVGAPKQVLVRNPLWPPDFKDVPKPTVDVGPKFGDDPF